MSGHPPCRNGVTGVKYITLWGNVGYYIAAKRYMEGLIRAGIPLTWTPMVWVPENPNHTPYLGTERGDRDLDPFCNRTIEYSTVVLHIVPEFFPMWAEREKGKRLIGYVTWETDTLPSHWAKLLNQVDRLLVPCQWNKEVFIKGGVTIPIDVVPHIMRRDVQTADNRPRRADDKPFVFYLIETWTPRKAIWKTIRCYLDTFTQEDNALLVVKTSETSHSGTKLARFEKLANLYTYLRAKLKIPPWLRIRRGTDRYTTDLTKEYGSPAPIRFITDELSDDQINDLHRSGDCYVSLCHGEGWGLGAFDAAAFGNGVIITGYGGQLDYLPPDLAYLVDYSMIPVRDESFPKDRFRDHRWAEPDMEQASKFMRHAYENRAEVGERGAALSRHIRTVFNEERITESFIRFLKD